MITKQMRSIAENHSAGLVATVNADGTPNVSPKGTMVVLDNFTIIFAEIASPVTLSNLKERPVLEINFLDVLTRRCFRAKGTTEIIPPDAIDFQALLHHFEKYGELTKRIRHIIRVNVTKAMIVSSPSYAVGETEENLKARYIAHFNNLADST